MSDTHPLLQLNREAQAELRKKEAAVDERLAQLRSEIEKALAEKGDLSSALDKLEQANGVYRRLYGWPIEANTVTVNQSDREVELSGQVERQEGAKPRARLGPQRYLMFDALGRSHGMSLADLAADARLNTKRVKVQMVSDLRIGLVTGTDLHYQLTPAGHDLLARFRSYKAAHNQSLPTRDDLPVEDGRDEPETNEMMEGVMQG